MTHDSPTPNRAFVAMMALMISLVALATDIMLPAMSQIGVDLGVPNANDLQWIVSGLFLGFAIGQLLAGPLSDSFGRRPVIFGGFALFFVGCILTLLAQSFETLLAGRVLQGLGLAGPRIVSNAIIRDLYIGRAMAKVMSVIMVLFILVPAIAPALGQAIIAIAGWRATFALLLGIGIISVLWFGLQQSETLTPENRRAFSARLIWHGTREVLENRAALGHTLALGFIFGPFLAYLSTAEKIFHQIYDVGNLFALYFAIAALAIGSASLVNARLVEQLGMKYLTRRAILLSVAMAAAFALCTYAFGGRPPLWMFMVWLAVMFFCVGICFGNLNALALEPLGHIAGLGAAVIGSVSTFMSLPVAWVISNSFAGTVTLLVTGFMLASVATLATFNWGVREQSA